MNKEYLKSILAFLCVVFGFLTCIISLYSFNDNEPSYILWLLLSFSLCIIGIFSCIFSYRRHKIIDKLKNNELPNIVHWQYFPRNYKLVELQLDENHYINMSIIFLVGVLGLLIILGFTFSSAPIPTLLAIILTLLLFIACSISFSLVNTYYSKQLNQQLETIISSNYIYFNGELHSAQKGLYYLEDIRIFLDDQYYIQFIYGAPGTPYGPFSTVTVPIPEGELAIAYTIKETYMALLEK